MAETARTQPLSTAWVGRPPLRVVDGQAAPATAGERPATPTSRWLAEPNVGRGALRGAALGFVCSLVGIGTFGTVSGMDPGSALGMGAFVGVWGGAGFGFMLGGTIPFARHLDAVAHSNRNHEETSDDPAAR